MLRRMASESAAWGDSRLLIAGHAAALLLLGLVAFSRNEAYLLNDYDGAFYRTVVKLQYEWTSWAPRLGGNPLAALGNSLFCVQTLASPGHAIGAWLGGGETNAVATYTVIALEGFLAFLFFGASLRLDRTLTLAGAWIYSLGSLPFVDRAQWFPISRVAPVFFEFVAAQLLMIGAFRRVGRGGPLASAAWTLLIAAVLAWALSCSPMGLILCAPPIAIFGVLLIAAAGDRGERVAKGLALAALAGVSAPAFLPYFAGSFLHSVPTFFARELENDRLALHWISGVFKVGGFGWLYMPFGALFLFGAVRAVRRERGPLLAVATASLLQFGGALALGLPVVLGRLPYLGPSPIYFEIYAWPFWSLLVASPFLDLSAGRIPPLLQKATPAALLPACALAACLAFRSAPARAFPYPPTAPPLVAHLKESVGLSPGAEFRGSVATFSGADPSGVGWLDLHRQDVERAVRTGNDARAMGLWHHGIPTLHEYNQLMSPPYYLLLSRLLARPGDRQMRSVIVLTRPDAPFLASLGVRFVISDAPFDAPGVRPVLRDDGSDLRLYELPKPNLGGYSPTRPRVEASASGALAALAAPGFSFRDEVVVERPLGTELARATDVRFRAERDGWSLSASSPGRSLLLLPLQYSRCLELDVLSGEDVRLERANLAQAGLLFSGKLDVRLRFASGPFNNPWGRLRDYRDLLRVGFRELGRD